MSGFSALGLVEYAVLSHCQDASGAGFDRNAGRADAARVVNRNPLLGGAVGLFLQLDAHGRVDVHAAGPQLQLAIGRCRAKLRAVANRPNHVVAEESGLLV